MFLLGQIEFEHPVRVQKRFQHIYIKKCYVHIAKTLNKPVLILIQVETDRQVKHFTLAISQKLSDKNDFRLKRRKIEGSTNF